MILFTAMQNIESTIKELFNEHWEALADLENKIPDIIKIRDVLLALIQRDGALLLCGNGGSAADCVHWAAEWRVRFHNDRRALHAEAL